MACQKVCKQGRMMHESKGQHIDKAPSLHLFHIARRRHPYIDSTNSLITREICKTDGAKILEEAISDIKCCNLVLMSWPC